MREVVRHGLSFDVVPDYDEGIVSWARAFVVDEEAFRVDSRVAGRPPLMGRGSLFANAVIDHRGRAAFRRHPPSSRCLFNGQTFI